jgi:FkbM family methyltransferase
MPTRGRLVPRRLEKVLWRLSPRRYADNCGVRLPLRHPAISSVIRQRIYRGKYEDREAELISRWLEPDDRVMEVGAGIGFLSALCAKIVGDANVTAYEANPELIPLIRAVHEANGASPHVENALLGKGSGERNFYVEPDFWDSSTLRGSDRARSVRVPQLDAADELARLRPTFLIVDIEGGECEFFSDLDLAMIRKLCIEVHPRLVGNAALSGLVAGFFAQGLALEFGGLRGEVLLFHRADRASAPSPVQNGDSRAG